MALEKTTLPDFDAKPEPYPARGLAACVVNDPTVHRGEIHYEDGTVVEPPAATATPQFPVEHVPDHQDVAPPAAPREILERLRIM